jgi:hypothetical protein
MPGPSEPVIAGRLDNLRSPRARHIVRRREQQRSKPSSIRNFIHKGLCR